MTHLEPVLAELQSTITELERSATRLREEDLPREEAAELVEGCAQLAGRLGAALDRHSRSVDHGSAPGQDELL